MIQLTAKISEKEKEGGLLDLNGNSEIVQDFSTIFDEKIIGQGEAKKSILNFLEEIISGININDESHKHKPKGKALCIGPSGTGKTLLAQTLQGVLNEHYGTSIEIIKINCADYPGDRLGAISSLKGASTGYMGGDKKAILHPDNIDIEKGIRVVLFDEINRGGEALRGLMLSILDTGVLDVNYIPPKDAMIKTTPIKVGRKEFDIPKQKQDDTEQNVVKAYFGNTIIIMTGNYGLDEIESEQAGGIGYNNNSKDIGKIDVKGIINEVLEKETRSEFRGRMKIIPFFYFSKEETKEIINILIKKIVTQALKVENGFAIKFDERAEKYILKNIFDNPNYRKYNGRYIEDFFNENIIAKLSVAINDEIFKDMDSMMLVSTNAGKLSFSKVGLVEREIEDTSGKVVELVRK